MKDNQLLEFEVGVGFFVKDTLKHAGSVVWYFVADTIEEAEILLEKEAKKFCDTHATGSEEFEYSHEWIAMHAVDKDTFEPIGEPVQL